ncbi:MAG: hypothetical protein M0R32_10390 [Candidatus Cloacimonetes bacterium]|jgi:hypothetical protein|nr:hypothetical protein [Candidatus Cloacimonadota bacterium]
MESNTYGDSIVVLEDSNSSSKYQEYSCKIGKDFTEKDKSAFKSPDRKEEDRLVAHFQKTGCQETHNKLFEIRKPTISVWARKYAWICDGEEDLFSELSMIWLKCIQKYKYEPNLRAVRTKEGHLVKDENDVVKKVFKRTPFNTFIFTSFQNHIRNVIKKKYSKKRLDDSGRPIEFGMHSLDYEYGDDGEGTTLYEIYMDEKSEGNMDPSKIGADWIIEEICQGDKSIQQALKKFVNDGYVKDIKMACKLKSGILRLKKYDRDVLISGGQQAHQHLKSMILSSERYGHDFQISSYQIFPKKVVFEIVSADDSLSIKVNEAIEKAKGRLMI